LKTSMLILNFSSELPLALDNDIFTHLRNKHDYVLKKAKQHLFDTKRFPVIPSTTVFEANYGIQKGVVKKNFTEEQANNQKKEIDSLLLSYSVIDFNQRASEIAAYIFARLSQSDRNKHWRDLFIVATAVSHNYGLATQNKKDIELIANHLPEGLDLRLAIWKP
jgi:predicted nucleic acid-binding protein